MTEETSSRFHCDAFVAENADREVHKSPHPFGRPPMAALADGKFRDAAAIARRLTTSLATRQSSFDVWAALAQLDMLLSDYRRLAPRFSFEQLTGQPSVAAGNEYRRTLVEPAALNRLEAACSELAGTARSGALAGARVMDVRIVRAGPWGGETGEMVVEALSNHAMAGTASLWILVHGEGVDGPMQVRLDVFEVVRWAWAPDFLAALSTTGEGILRGILDWPYLFERLAACLDAVPAAQAEDGSFVLTAPPEAMVEDERVTDALALHPALATLLCRTG